MGSLLRVPKVQLFLTLLFIFAVNYFQNPQTSRIVVFFTSIIMTLALDLIYTYIKRKKVYLSDAALVTGAIIGLLISPNSLWYEVAVASAVAVGLKIFLRPGGRHIFNPAASGLLVWGLIFGQTVAWWGPSLENFLSTGALLTPLLVSAWRMRRYLTISSFLFIYVFWYVIQTGDLNAVSTTLFDPTILFFAFVMLPEPMTSPVNIKRQFLYGVLVAVIVRILTLPLFSQVPFPDILIPALLIGNMVLYRYR